MSLPPISAAQDSSFLDSTAGQKRLSLMSCTDGSDGYPTLVDFVAHMEKYLAGKKRADRTVITTSDLEHIRHLLSDPAALRADPNPNHRTWVKKTFFLKSTPFGSIVCHKEKGQPIGRPIAVKESMYFILKDAHASEGHGGRDKTAKAVKNTHSYIRKGLICIFLETCPTCQTRNEAAKKERRSVQLDGQRMIHSHSTISFGTDFWSPTSPTGFEIQSLHGNRTSLFQYTSPVANPENQPHLAIRRPTMPPELALVPAAPVAAGRSRYGSYPSYLAPRKIHREQDSHFADHTSISVRHLHSPYSIIPRTAMGSEFNSPHLLNQQEEQSSLNSMDSMPEIFSPTYQLYPTGLNEISLWSDDSQALAPPNDGLEPALNLDLSNIWTQQNENATVVESAPLFAPQPQLPPSNKFKYPFFDQSMASTLHDSQIPTWEAVSPMSGMFVREFNQIEGLQLS